LSPSMPDILWVGLAYGGLFGTLDGGANWKVLYATDLVNDIANAIIVFEVDPTNANVIYLCRGSGGS